MNEVYEFLKAAGTYYLATTEDGEPRVRPFGTVDIWEGKLTIQTGYVKPVAKQMLANPRVEICAMSQDGRWIRVTADAVPVKDDAKRFASLTSPLTTTMTIDPSKQKTISITLAANRETRSWPALPCIRIPKSIKPATTMTTSSSASWPTPSTWMRPLR